MKYDLTTPVTGLNGKPALNESGVDGTMYDILLMAAGADMDGDGNPIKGLQKVKRYNTLLKILGHAGETVELSIDDVALLNEAVLIFPTVIAGKARAFLDQQAE